MPTQSGTVWRSNIDIMIDPEEKKYLMHFLLFGHFHEKVFGESLLMYV